MLQNFHYQTTSWLPPVPGLRVAALTSKPVADGQSTGCANLHTLSAPEKNTMETPPVNGFMAMRDSAKLDFFTIRADAVQDGVLAVIDTLAEYLVWDGMDRRLRAIASANHTDKPEAVVTVKQIANDIKIRVGHDLCERTIERAIKKLQDASLIHVMPRFQHGRRQASSFILLFSASMSERQNKSRRGNKSIGSNDSATAASTDYASTQKKINHDDIRPQVKSARTSFGLSPITEYLQRVQACIGQAPDVSSHASDETNEERQQNSVQNCTLSVSPSMDRTTEGESPTNGQSQAVIIKADAPNDSHPTSMSPLFNKEEKENKKVFKNVYSISDFSKKESPKENRTVLQAGAETGYYLDTVHRSGWVSSPKRHLQGYFGSLSTYLFFNKYRTIETMTEWFQQQENRINSGETTLYDVLATAGITPERSQDYEQKTTIRIQK
jgi:hypothetical protein